MSNGFGFSSNLDGRSSNSGSNSTHNNKNAGNPFARPIQTGTFPNASSSLGSSTIFGGFPNSNSTAGKQASFESTTGGSKSAAGDAKSSNRQQHTFGGHGTLQGGFHKAGKQRSK